MKISIITATIDNDVMLARTLDSVAQQSYSDIDHIVVDGYDSSRDAALYEGYPGVRHFHREKNGVYDALNYGIQQARGEIIGLLHGGDRYADKDVLAIVAKAFEDDPELDFVYGDIRFYNGHSLKKGRIYYGSTFRPEYLRYGMAPPHPSLYMRRRAVDVTGPYRRDLRLASDLDMWIRLFKNKSLKYKSIPMVFVEMSTGGMSTTFQSRLIDNNIEKLKALRVNGISANPILLGIKYLLILRDEIFDPRKKKA